MVLATNIAETSLTIEDVVYVVDTGKLKVRLMHTALRGCASVAALAVCTLLCLRVTLR